MLSPVSPLSRARVVGAALPVEDVRYPANIANESFCSSSLQYSLHVSNLIFHPLYALHDAFTVSGANSLRSEQVQAIRTHEPLYSSSIRPRQQDSLLYTQFSRTHSSSISSSIHCRTHLSLYLNISMCDLVLKDLLRRI
jgi:hypothetical protein